MNALADCPATYFARWRRTIDREPLRYLVSGGASAIANNAILIAGDRADFGYTCLMVLTWAIGGSIAYALHVRFTFRAAASLLSFVRFMGGIALGMPGGFAVLAALRSGIGLPMWMAALVSTMAMFGYNYLSARIAILWRRPRGMKCNSPPADGSSLPGDKANC